MCIANATTATEEEIEITQEMIDAGLRELGIMCDLWTSVSEVTGADVCEVYIAMKRLEPAGRAVVRRGTR